MMQLANVTFLGGYDAVVGPDSLLPMFKTVAIPASGHGSAEFSSRTWFLEAICVLHNCGVVQCDNVWLLKRDIRRLLRLIRRETKKAELEDGSSSKSTEVLLSQVHPLLRVVRSRWDTPLPRKNLCTVCRHPPEDRGSQPR